MSSNNYKYTEYSPALFTTICDNSCSVVADKTMTNKRLECIPSGVTREAEGAVAPRHSRQGGAKQPCHFFLAK